MSQTSDYTESVEFDSSLCSKFLTEGRQCPLRPAPGDTLAGLLAGPPMCAYHARASTGLHAVPKPARPGRADQGAALYSFARAEAGATLAVLRAVEEAAFAKLIAQGRRFRPEDVMDAGNPLGLSGGHAARKAADVRLANVALRRADGGQLELVAVLPIHPGVELVIEREAAASES